LSRLEQLKTKDERDGAAKQWLVETIKMSKKLDLVVPVVIEFRLAESDRVNLVKIERRFIRN
jgi:hypothetical protein